MLKELGDYKNRMASMFVNDDKICKLLLGEKYETEVEDLDKELDKYVIPHLYVEGVITETKSYIMLDTIMSKAYDNTKTIKVVVQAICHRDIIKYAQKPKGYTGYRYDVLSQYIEELVCPKEKKSKDAIIRKFGIGTFELEDVDLFLTKEFVGRVMTFSVPTFR